MRPTSRRRAARWLAAGLLALGLSSEASADSPYAPIQVPKSDGAPRPPIRYGANDPPRTLPENVPAPAVPVPVAPPVVVEEPPPPPSPWAKIPPVAILPRLGGFIIPPDGPGYYTFLDYFKRDRRAGPPPIPFPATSPSPGTAFDADFRFLEDPNYGPRDLIDRFKRIPFCDQWLFSSGGEFRHRYMDEVNSRLTGRNNEYHLLRLRTHADVWKNDDFRFFIEFLAADSYYQTLPPLPIDRNLAEMQNLFIDLKLFSAGGGAPAYVRAGRQELVYGSQRLISPLDWANARRTFDGVKLFWHSRDWDLDVFWSKPVVVHPTRLDSWDIDQNFSGAWATWKPRKGTAIDAYVLNLNQGRPVAVGRNGVGGGFDIFTFGSRAAGDFDGRFLYDAEAMLQTGIRANQEVMAGAYTLGLGYRAKNCPWNPTVWAYNDWASGDANPGGPGRSTTFNQLFAFGHYYLGFTDFVGRQNINDLNVQVSLNPQPWLLVLAQYHYYTLVHSNDALYNTAGVPLRRSPGGLAGRDVGQNLDVMVNVHLTKRQDLLVGYSQFFSGAFIRNTGGPASANLFYTQYSYKW